MRFIPAALQAHLDEGATTLCHCWKISPIRAAPIGLTDHDAPLRFDAVEFDPGAGLDAGNLESVSGLAPDNLEVIGALHSDSITEAALSGGVFDNAEVDLFLVNWRDVSQRVLLFRGSIGETSRGTISFQAELRGLSHRLDQPTGRVYQRRCDAELGDARCGLSLTPVSGTVSAIEGGAIIPTTPPAEEEGVFVNGALQWLTGKNQNTTQLVRDDSGGRFTLWVPPPFTPEPGDTFNLLPGCDKTLTTCSSRFGNANNFRGFPHMPGDDWLTLYPSSTEENDGGALT